MPKRPASIKEIISLETEEQAAVIEWCEFMGHPYNMIYANMNGSHKSIPSALKARREGLKAGIPDLTLPVTKVHAATGLFYKVGLYIEMKRRKGGTISLPQIKWHDALRKQGYHVVVARGFDEAKAAICDYMGVTNA